MDQCERLVFCSRWCWRFCRRALTPKRWSAGPTVVRTSGLRSGRSSGQAPRSTGRPPRKRPPVRWWCVAACLAAGLSLPATPLRSPRRRTGQVVASRRRRATGRRAAISRRRLLRATGRAVGSLNLPRSLHRPPKLMTIETSALSPPPRSRRHKPSRLARVAMIAAAVRIVSARPWSPVCRHRSRSRCTRGCRVSSP